MEDIPTGGRNVGHLYGDTDSARYPIQRHTKSSGGMASLLIPQRAGTLKKGSYIQIKGNPCKIVNISTSKTGKHGHAKMNITGIDVLTKKKHEELAPTSHNVMVPEIKRDEYQLITHDDQFLTVLTDDGNTKDDIPVPEESEFMDKIVDALSTGDKDVLVSVISAPVGSDPGACELKQLVVDVRLAEVQ